ncbi:MAG: M20/M25/M40 family metallo-hydrolase [Gemmatimonadetes bacterium]|nr:M20/M25/M40 family metallo-hydrolase [Gemmatimonadota bacterium]
MTRRSSVAVPFVAALALGACAAPVSNTLSSTASPVPGAGSGAAMAASGASALEAAAATIKPADFFARISFLASDALRGRDTPSPGLESAAEYMVDHYRRLGLEPAGENGTYFQWYPYPMRRLTAAGARLVVAGANGQRQTLQLGRDFFTRGGTTADLSGGLVFVGQSGFGEAGSLRDRVAVAALPGPGNRDWRLLRNRQVTGAQRAGATALIHVLDAVWSADSIAKYAQQSQQPTRSLGGAIAYPEFYVTQDAARRMFAAGGVAFEQAWSGAAATDFRPVPLAGVTVTAASPQESVDQGRAPNVVAVLRGSDPVLRNEYVVLSAHMDHVGVGRPDARGDSIYNGADDDASGTAALAEVAEAFASMPTRPRRSIVFLDVSGEEKGLIGSEWFSDHPTLPLAQIVADVNVDMIGRNSPDSIVVIGKNYSSLGGVVNAMRTRHPEIGLIAADDIWPQERFFFRSDHFNFARKEVPAIFFFSGVHEDYHRPSDEVSKIDTQKATRVARYIFYTVNEIANADQRPQWDPKGLEEVRALTR